MSTIHKRWAPLTDMWRRPVLFQSYNALTVCLSTAVSHEAARISTEHDGVFLFIIAADCGKILDCKTTEKKSMCIVNRIYVCLDMCRMMMIVPVTAAPPPNNWWWTVQISRRASQSNSTVRVWREVYIQTGRSSHNYGILPQRNRFFFPLLFDWLTEIPSCNLGVSWRNIFVVFFSTYKKILGAMLWVKLWPLPSKFLAAGENTKWRLWYIVLSFRQRKNIYSQCWRE